MIANPRVEWTEIGWIEVDTATVGLGTAPAGGCWAAYPVELAHDRAGRLLGARICLTTDVDELEGIWRPAGTFKATDGLVLALYSAQHIDRLVTLSRAALQSERDFVMDLYGASIAAVTGNQHIPRPGADWPRVRVYVPPRQRRKVKDAGSFWRVEQIKPFRIFEEELAQDRARYVLTFGTRLDPRPATAGPGDRSQGAGPDPFLRRPPVPGAVRQRRRPHRRTVVVRLISRCGSA